MSTHVFVDDRWGLSHGGIEHRVNELGCRWHRRNALQTSYCRHGGECRKAVGLIRGEDTSG